MIKVISTILFLLTFISVFSYPIRPITLRELIDSSDYIVIATINNPEKVPRMSVKEELDTTVMARYTVTRDGIAGLNIKEVLKGNLKSSQEILVRYMYGMACPEPASYPDSGTVIAFLKRDVETSLFYTVALSYGSKIMENERDLLTYKSRIIEYLDLSIIKEKKAKKLATIEWIMRCIEKDATRWEGSYELSREDYYMSFYDASELPKFVEDLTIEQKQRIKDLVISTDTLGIDELNLLNVVEWKDSPQMMDHLIANLFFLDYFAVRIIMSKLIKGVTKQEFDNYIDRLNNMEFDDLKKAANRDYLVERSTKYYESEKDK